MKIMHVSGAAAALFLIGSYTVAGAGGHESGEAAAADGPDSGHCKYVQENMFAGPFDVCQEPADEATCGEIGNTNDNHDAFHHGGICPAEGLIGTCDLGDSKVRYYSGDASGLEIGCGFQGGDWFTDEG